MAKKINVRKILSLHHQNLSINQIAKGHHFSKHSVIDVIHRANELKFDDSTLGSLNDEELYQLFFPEKFAGSQLYFKPDYEHVHQELKGHGVTLKLLCRNIAIQCHQICSQSVILLFALDITIIMYLKILQTGSFINLVLELK